MVMYKKGAPETFLRYRSAVESKTNFLNSSGKNIAQKIDQGSQCSDPDDRDNDDDNSMNHFPLFFFGNGQRIQTGQSRRGGKVAFHTVQVDGMGQTVE